LTSTVFGLVAGACVVLAVALLVSVVVLQLVLRAEDGSRACRVALEVLGFLWATPFAVLGLVLALLGGGRAIRWSEGALELVGDRFVLGIVLTINRIAAYTWGWVIVYRSETDRRNATLRRHEREHVRQAEILGPLFPVAYLVACLVAALQGRAWYRDNVFEAAAREAADE